MDTLINVVIPVFGLILTGYLAGRFEVLGPESAAALTRFVYYFAFPAALFVSLPERRLTRRSTGPSSGHTSVGPYRRFLLH
jgi:predicted permease